MQGPRAGRVSVGGEPGVPKSSHSQPFPPACPQVLGNELLGDSLFSTPWASGLLSPETKATAA